MKISLCEELDKCEAIWQKFVMPQCVWDLWAVRKTFVDVYGYPVKFVTAYENNKLVAALPTWYNTEEKRWEWISDQWAEGNYPFAEDKQVVSDMISYLPGKVFLDAIRQDKADLFSDKLERDSDHFGFSVSVRGGTWEGVLSSMPARKENVRRNLKAMEKIEPKVFFDRESDLANLFALNIYRMRQKVDKYDDEELSVYESGDRNQKVIQELWKRGTGEFKSRIMAVEVAGKVVGVMFNLIWNDKYLQLHRGEDVLSADGIGSYMNKLVVEDAIKMGCDYVDFCMEEHHWKKNWCEPEATYKLVTENPLTTKKEVSESFSCL
jgi:hypothetical protein